MKPRRGASALEMAFILPILLLVLAQIIDGVDGPLARRYDIRNVIPKYDGCILDLVIDYVARGPDPHARPRLRRRQRRLLRQSVLRPGAPPPGRGGSAARPPSFDAHRPWLHAMLWLARGGVDPMMKPSGTRSPRDAHLEKARSMIPLLRLTRATGP